MATVFIPSLLQGLCKGERRVEVAGATVRQVINNLDQVCPGIKARIIEDEGLIPGISVAVDGEVTEIGLLQPVSERSEIHILPAIGGG
jgi:hypothetical protein